MIKISRKVYNAIVAHGKKDLPNECCGYLAGKDDLIDTHYELTNTDHSPEHFAFDPKEQFATVRAAREAGRAILANYHSHPETPSRPSEEDIRLAFDPHIKYFILSLAAEEPVLNGFSIVKGVVEKLEVLIVD